MQRHRCTKCRNPIRSLAVARTGEGDDDWFHPDCWAEVCSSEQEQYERQVQTAGITALLAPYISSPTSILVAVSGVAEQPQA